MSEAALLEIQDLSCIRNDRTLFEHLEFALEPGEMLVVEGPNGCGKTSLLRILTGLRLADSGDVLWRGQPIDRLAGDYYEQVTYVGHHDGVKHELSCLENLRLARAMGIPSVRDLDDVLEQVNLYAYGDSEVGSLSAGQKRRLALARLLATDSMIWILDEPFTSLDKASMAMFSEMFEQQLQRSGIIVVTSHHDISLPTLALQRLNLGQQP
ncbi:MAG: cytochrome c biogenesis heme-transporting ATPase CcmA [Gammaproteobacteria bacterium]|nr:cytochrome c biogenesis heme-transporting ATPase CcmA [Gammaproteobacteria bacterium]MDH3449325.1 cytochrome c biogenesis heme-transporting ATPase CcmA [Gammaproteobacteria bacterium]